MKIIKNFPPNYKEIEKVFGEDKRCVYCYEDTIYNLHDIQLEVHHIAHEQIHSEQQKELGADYWWMRYLEDREFRLKQELEAYGGQLKFVKNKVKDAIFKRFLDDIAGALASETYGNLLTKPQAETKLRHLLKKL